MAKRIKKQIKGPTPTIYCPYIPMMTVKVKAKNLKLKTIWNGSVQVRRNRNRSLRTDH